MTNLKQLDKAIEVLKPFVLQRRFEKWNQVINSRSNSVRIVLENLQDPFNGSACLRTGDGFGIQNYDVIETINNFKAYESDSTTTGVQRWLTTNYHRSSRKCIENLKNEGYVTLGACLSEKSLPLKDVLKKLKREENHGNSEKFPKLALIFGNEQRGLTKSIQKHCDHIYQLDMVGFAQSFNINVSVAISLAILKENGVINQDVNGSHKELDTDKNVENHLNTGYKANYPLKEEERKKLLLSWLLGVTPHYQDLFSRHNIELDEF